MAHTLLTPTRAKTLRFLYHHLSRFGYLPDRTVLARFFGCSRAAIGQRFAVMRNMGWLVYTPHKPDDIRITAEGLEWITANGAGRAPDWRRASADHEPLAGSGYEDAYRQEHMTRRTVPATSQPVVVHEKDQARDRHYSTEVRDLSRDILVLASRVGNPELAERCAEMFSILHR